MLGLAKLAAVGLTATALWGGWAVVTVQDLPEYYVAGQEYTIEFQVRQHGHNLLTGLEPRLVLASSQRRLGGLMGGKDETVIPAVARGNGTYAVTFTAPAVERLFLTIKSGFGSSEARIPAQPVARRGTAAPVVTAAQRGEVLFTAKGCNVCHQDIQVGPALMGRQLARDLVVQKIKNPNSQVMPDLGLSDAEANAIAAFLASGAGAAGR
jgi:mono/diheme cytochrome c family protein